MANPFHPRPHTVSYESAQQMGHPSSNIASSSEFSAGVPQPQAGLVSALNSASINRIDANHGMFNDVAGNQTIHQNQTFQNTHNFYNTHEHAMSVEMRVRISFT
jgi:hypothetical protein